MSNISPLFVLAKAGTTSALVVHSMEIGISNFQLVKPPFWDIQHEYKVLVECY